MPKFDGVSCICLQKLTPIRGRKLATTNYYDKLDKAFTEVNPDKGTET